MFKKSSLWLLIICLVISACSISVFASELTQGSDESVELPNANVTVLDPITLPANDYMVWPSGDENVDRPLQVVMNFKAEDTLEEASAGAFGKYICDFYLTFTGLANGTVTADNCYLAGEYGEFGWIVIPTDGLVVEDGVEYPVVAAYDANLTYENICDYVKSFTAAIFIDGAILEANPDFKVSLALKMTNPDDESDVLTIGEPAVYDVEALTKPHADVSVLNPTILTPEDEYFLWDGSLHDGEENLPLQVVMNFKAKDSFAAAQASKYGKYICDFYLTFGGAEGTFSTAGCYLAGNYGEFGWIAIPADVVAENLEYNVAYPVVAAYDANLTYENICDYVKDFTAAIYIAPELLEANPDFTVTLELRMTNPDNADDYFVVGEPAVYDATELRTGVQKGEDIADLENNTQVGGTVDAEANAEAIESAKDELAEQFPELSDEEIASATIELEIKFESLEFVEGKAPTSYSYDVSPMLAVGESKVKVSELDAPVTFRLPVHSAEMRTRANVYHNGELFGTYDIQTENGEMFVEVSSKSFSTYTVEPIDTAIEVDTLDELIEALAADNDCEIIITAQIVIPEGTTYTLDLNGKTVNSVFNGNSTTNHIYALSNKGTLTIIDTSAEQNGSINSRGIYNYGSLTLNAGAINSIDGNGGYAVNNESGSTFVMNGGVVATTYEDDYQSSEGGYDATPLEVPAGCTATLNGGKIIDVCDFTFAISAAGTLNIPETSTIEVIGTHGAIAVSGGVTTINAGKFSIPADEYSRTDNVLYVSGGSLVINGGTFIGDSDVPSGGSCLCDVNGTAVVNGGSFKGSSGGDVWGTTGTTIKGGTFENLTETEHIAPGFELGENGEVVKAVVMLLEVTDAQGNVTNYEGFTGFKDLNLANCTIKLLGDVSDASLLLYDDDVNVTLDLNGYSYIRTGAKDCAISLTKGAELTIIDSSAAKTGKISADTYVVWIMNGNLTVEAGVLEATNAGKVAIYANAAEVVINGGKISAAGDAITIGENFLESRGASTVEINGGELVAGGRGVASARYAQATSTLIVTGGKITSTGDSINMTTGTTEVSGGTFSTEIPADYCKDGFTVVENVDGTFGVEVAPSYVAEIGDQGYMTLADALAAVKEGETIVIIGTVEEGTIKLPSTLKNVTIKGAEAAVINNTTITTADGNSYSYVGLTFDGIVFENSRLVFTGWRTGEEVIENLTITNCVFQNLNDDTNMAAVHINKDVSAPVNGFTFTNNVVKNLTGGQKSGIYTVNTGNVTITGNTFDNIVFRPVLLQLADCDGNVDDVVISNNNIANTTRLQVYGSELDNGDGTWTPNGTDTLSVEINGNIFENISGYYICTWGINGEANIAENYYDDNIEGKIYWNNEKPTDAAGLNTIGVYPYYTELNEDGTIDIDSKVEAPKAYVAFIGEVGYTSVEAALEAAVDGDVIVLVVDLQDLSITVTKNVTISGNVTLHNVSISATGATELTVSGLTFTGNSWINCGTANKLTVSGVNANVTPSNNSATNSRSAFISLGRSEQHQLELVVENCSIVSKGGSNPILGWAAITKATITGNTFGASDAYQTNSDSIKFMSVANGATLTFKNNTVYSNYNGIAIAQNTTRDNAYTAIFEDNTFIGGADHIWIEISGGSVCHATVNASSTNTVNGNEFTTNDIKYHYGVIKSFTSYLGVDVVTDDNGKVIGGKLAANCYSESAIAPGFEVNEKGEVVKAIVYVAEVNGEKFTSLQDALNVGGTVKLLTDVTFDAVYTSNKTHWNGDLNYELNVGKDVVLDLNGYTIKSVGGSTHSYYALICVRSGSLTVTDSSDAQTGAIVCSSVTSGAYTIYNNAALVIEGGKIANTIGGRAIQSVTVKDTSLTISGGVIESTGIAVRVASEGSNGTHTVVITGGTINAGSYAIWTPVKNGETDVINFTINGGTFNGKILFNSYVPGADYTTDKVEFNGGTFNGNVIFGEQGDADADSALVAALAGNVVSGGTFVNNVSDYVADGFKLVENTNGTFGVEEAPAYIAEVNGEKFTSLQDAIDAASNGGTVTLLENVELESYVSVAAGANVTIDLNGKTISAANGNVIRNTSGGTLKLMNGTVTRNAGTAGYALNNENSASVMILENVTINGGVYTSGKLTATNTNLYQPFASRHAIYATGCAVEINGGNYHNYNAGNATIFSANGAVVTINGGTFSIDNGQQTHGWTSCLLDATNGGSIVINAGEFKGHFRVQANSSMQINGGTFENTHNEAYSVYTGAKVEVSGGTFTDAAAQNFAKANLVSGFEVNEDGEVVKAIVYVAEVDGEKFGTFLEALAYAVENGKTEIKVLSSVREVMPTDVEIILKDNLTITSANGEPVELKFYNNGTSYDFVIDCEGYGDYAFTIGENVTFQIEDRLVWIGYYGSNIDVVVNGKLIGYQLWVGGDLYVNETGLAKTTGEALVLRRGKTLFVNGGKVEANYFQILAGNIFAENGAEIECGTIRIGNTGDFAGEGNVSISIWDSTLTSSGNIESATTHAAGVTIDLYNSKVAFNDYDGYGASKLDANTTLWINGEDADVTIKSLNNNGNVEIYDNGALKFTGNVTNNGAIVLEAGSKLAGPENMGVTTTGDTEYVDYVNGEYVVKNAVASINGVGYGTLADAINNAVANDVIKLIADVTLTEKIEITVNVTLDLNGKTITTGAEKVNFNALEISADVTIENGTLNSYRTGTTNGSIKILSGNVTLNGVTIYNEGFNALRVQSGATAELNNCIVTGQINAVGQTDIYGGKYYTGLSSKVTAYSGEFYFELSEKFVPEGYMPKANGDHWIIVEKPYVAEVGGVQYKSLQAAIDAADATNYTVTLLCDYTGEGIVISKKLCLDLGNFTYTIATSVGSTNTATNGIQILAESGAVTIRNGKIAIAPDKMGDAYTVYTLIQSYTNVLTLQNVTLDCENGVVPTGANFVAVNVNAGTATFDDNASIVNCDKADFVAINVWNNPNYSTSAAVNTTATAGTIEGKIDVDADSKMAVSGGTFTYALPEEFCAEGFIPTANDDGTYGVKAGKYVARNTTTGVGYETLKDALDAAQAGEEIELLEDVVMSEKLFITGAITLNGNGHTITPDANVTWWTQKPGKLVKNYAPWVVLQADCTLKNITINANSIAGGVKIENANVVFNNVVVSGTKADAITVVGTLTIENYFKVENTTSSYIAAQNGTVTTAPQTVFDMPKFTGSVSPAKSDLTGAVDATGESFFAAYGSTSYYKSLSGITSVTNLTLLKDVELTSNIKLSGTLDLNGHELTVAEGKTVSSNGNLVIEGGDVNVPLVLTNVNHTITAPEGANVTTTVADYRVVYSNGVYALAAIPYEAIVNGVKYEFVTDAIEAALAGNYTVELLRDVSLTELVEIADATLTITGNYKLTLNDNLVVLGETTLNISATLGGEVILENGAILKDSTINGDVFVAGAVTFRGANQVNMVYDFGTLTDHYGTSAPMAWTVEQGASLKIVNKARYGLGYGDNVTIYGSLTDALTARETLTDGDVAFFVHGIVAQESKGWNCASSLTVKDAYVVIGDNNSFGNKPGNYGGTYTFAFDNAVVNASRITFYEALSTTTFNFTNSDVKTGTFMTRDKDSVFNFVNTKLLSTATTNGNDEGNYHEGTINLTNSGITYSAQLTLNGLVKMDLNSSITAPTIIGNGTITIDATGIKGSKVVVAADMSGFEGTIELIGAAVCEITEEGLVISEPKAQIGNTYYATFNAALDAAQAGETIELLAPVVVAAGETLIIDKDVTITYTSDVAGEDMFTVRGTLKINAGTITYANTDATGSNVTVSTISCESGSVLEITGGVVENRTVKANGSTIYSYAIDLLSVSGDVTATISGGTVYSDYMAIRQFNNNSATKNTLNITGGYVYGARRGVQVHFDNNSAYLEITDGKIEGGDYALCFLTTSENLKVSGGEFIGSVWYSGTDGFIEGGKFDEEVYDGYCATGFIPTTNADGSYGVKVGVYTTEVDGVKYESFADALNAATANSTVKLLADVDMGNATILVMGNKIVDLNGHTLTAYAFVAFNGSHIVDNGETKGLLKVPYKSIMLSNEEYMMLPIWNANENTEGYVFVDPSYAGRVVVSENEGVKNSFIIDYRPNIAGGGVSSKPTFADGAANNDLVFEFVIRCYTGDSYSATAFGVTDELISTVYTNGTSIRFTVTGVGNRYDKYEVVAVIRSSAGVYTSDVIYTYVPESSSDAQ